MGDPFQPGNSVWSDIHSSPNADNSQPAMHFEDHEASLNYINVERTQVINAGGDGTNVACLLEGDQSNSTAVNFVELHGADFEDEYNRYLEGRFAVNCKKSIQTNRIASDVDMHLDSISKYNRIHCKDLLDVYSDFNYNYLTYTVNSASGKW